MHRTKRIRLGIIVALVLAALVALVLAPTAAGARAAPAPFNPLFASGATCTPIAGGRAALSVL